MKAHPAAEIFPMLTSLEMGVLARSIKEHGQKHPIVVHEGQILDGRNRFRACQINGIKPWTEEWDGKGSPTAFVIACNLHRRHMDESQRAIVAARASEMFEEEASARMRAGRRDPSANLREPRRKSAEQAAEMLNVSPRTVENGRRVIDRGTPDLVAAVERGEVAVSAAAEVAKLSAQKQAAIVKRGPEAVRETAKEMRQARPKNNTDELFDELVRLWKRAGNDVRRRFVEFIEQ